MRNSSFPKFARNLNLTPREKERKDPIYLSDANQAAQYKLSIISLREKLTEKESLTLAKLVANSSLADHFNYYMIVRTEVNSHDNHRNITGIALVSRIISAVNQFKDYASQAKTYAAILAQNNYYSTPEMINLLCDLNDLLWGYTGAWSRNKTLLVAAVNDIHYQYPSKLPDADDQLALVGTWSPPDQAYYIILDRNIMIAKLAYAFYGLNEFYQCQKLLLPLLNSKLDPGLKFFVDTVLTASYMYSSTPDSPEISKVTRHFMDAVIFHGKRTIDSRAYVVSLRQQHRLLTSDDFNDVNNSKLIIEETIVLLQLFIEQQQKLLADSSISDHLFFTSSPLKDILVILSQLSTRIFSGSEIGSTSILFVYSELSEIIDEIAAKFPDFIGDDQLVATPLNPVQCTLKLDLKFITSIITTILSNLTAIGLERKTKELKAELNTLSVSNANLSKNETEKDQILENPPVAENYQVEDPFKATKVDRLFIDSLPRQALNNTSIVASNFELVSLPVVINGAQLKVEFVEQLMLDTAELYGKTNFENLFLPTLKAKLYFHGAHKSQGLVSALVETDRAYHYKLRTYSAVYADFRVFFKRDGDKLIACAWGRHGSYLKEYPTESYTIYNFSKNLVDNPSLLELLKS